MNQKDLFDLKARTKKRARTIKSGMFIQELVRDEILERIKGINRKFKSISIVTGFSELWLQALPSAKIVSDDELLNFKSQNVDLIIHSMGLHHSNDPVGQIIQCARFLRPDGLFIGACFGGQTLFELRDSLASAEIELYGGISPRVSPMADIRDMGGLLQRAQLALSVADITNIPVKYKDMFHLMKDLRNMGETNIMNARTKKLTHHNLFKNAQKYYQSKYSDVSGKINSTYDLIFFSGWAPHASQPKPLRPGSSTKTLKEVLNATKAKSKD